MASSTAWTPRSCPSWATWPGCADVDLLAVGYGEHLVPALAAFIRSGGADLVPPEGTYFCFFDASEWLSEDRDVDALIEQCLDRGVAVAPGGDFGAGFASWIRVCFAADSVERCEEAARRLRGVLLGG